MTFALKMYKINKECEVIDNHAKYSFDQAWFLFRSARTSGTTFGWSRPVPSRPSRAKNLDHLYTGIYAL